MHTLSTISTQESSQADNGLISKSIYSLNYRAKLKLELGDEGLELGDGGVGAEIQGCEKGVEGGRKSSLGRQLALYTCSGRWEKG